ncbi:MAG: YbjN domain-containing protein [Acutalibacteraceae bacterium]|nr:YbjN domain-containing protein [Acutalibacteraceae bacterium]HCA55624.1 hypothetical protein [Oscillospiraceae bacterium]
MASITSRSATFYTMLCHVLEHNDIPYERIDDWCVTCLVSGREGDIRLNFTVDDSKMLVTLYAPTVRHIPQERLPDLSLAVCMLNHQLSDGAFCLDMVNGLLYFKLTVSFYNSEPSEDIYTYMLSIAADTVDRYRHRLRTLTGQPERYCLSEAS